MPKTPSPLTRDQLAQFLPNPRAIRAFEQALKLASEGNTDQIEALTQAVNDVALEAGIGSARAQLAFASLLAAIDEFSVNNAAVEARVNHVLAVVNSLPTGGGGGSTINTGTAIIDFGARETTASVAVTGQTGILSTTIPNAWVFPVATASNTADNHWTDDIAVTAGAVQAGVGFTIFATCRTGFGHGQFTVGWSWS